MTALTDWLFAATRLFGAALLALLMALTCADVFLRYVFKDPILGSNEITEFLLGGIVFSGLALVTGRRTHIVVSLFEPALMRLVPAVYTWLAVLFNLIGIMAIAGLVIVYTRFQYAQQNETEILALSWGHLGTVLSVLAVIGVLLGVRALRTPVGGDSPAPDDVS